METEQMMTCLLAEKRTNSEEKKTTAKYATIQQPLLSNRSETMAVARQWLSSHHVGTPTHTKATSA
jgi:hypothetical protein